MSPLPSIETHYAGCRFRSRLEARWAVLFDTLKIEWEYEPQGFTVDGRAYLPDFYLPRWLTYVEVKGDENAMTDDYRQMLHRFVHQADETTCASLVVLGPIPDVSNGRTPLHRRISKGFIYTGHGMTADDVTLGVEHGSAFFWWNGGLVTLSALIVQSWTDGGEIGLPIGNRARRAYNAARSARFEHGQAGR